VIAPRGAARCALVLAALSLGAWSCRRQQQTAPPAPLPPCDRLVASDEVSLSVEGSPAEGIALASAGDGALATWLGHDEQAQAFAALVRLDANGRPTGATRVATMLVPPPAAAVVPSLLVNDATAWLITWDDRSGCRAGAFDARTGAPRGEPRALGSGACFAPAIEPSRGPTVVQSTPAGWTVVPVVAGQAPGPVVAPAGDRWIARASDGVIVFVGDGEIVVRRPGGDARAVSRVEGDVAFLAIERAAEGYVLAWSPRRGGTRVQRLTPELGPWGGPERFSTGGSGLALARVRDEVWVATADAAGMLGVIRVRRGARSWGPETSRQGTIRAVSIAAVGDGAVLAYAAERVLGPSVFAFGIRCAAGEATR
jgi:hypothetical protein